MHNDLLFEIDYLNDQHGWIHCYLNFAVQRWHLWASDVFPPFRDLLHFLRAVQAQRLPYTLFWDEEGKGARFTAWPGTGDERTLRLQVTYSAQTDETWIDAELVREAVVQAFLDPLRDFVLYAGRPSRHAWAITLDDIKAFEHFRELPIPQRGDPDQPAAVRFEIEGPGYSQQPVQWVQLLLWEIPVERWMLMDCDPFWETWLAFLEQALAAAAPFTAEFVDTNAIELDKDLAAMPEFNLQRPPRTDYGDRLNAWPLARRELFRLAIRQTDFTHDDFLIFDETLDRRQFVLAFVEAFGDYLANEYEPFEDWQTGQVCDLRQRLMERVWMLQAGARLMDARRVGKDG